MHLRRLAVTATAAAAAALTVAPQALAQAVPGAAEHRPADHLTVTVADSGRAATDGTFELYCHPTSGDHPRAEAACDGLDELTTWGKDPFAPVGSGTRCTMQYGGPVSAHVRGWWAGKRVNAHFNRENGCEMKRWDTLVPLLPRTNIQSQQM
ncbi:Subtilisin inhibitor-like [Streptomyces sp. WMMB 714]|uniref:SSI family serine proteinase inhibitor n=1 Tax=Streptomyces sp. WMMB 714 TaxID=1286822 RepID=UPI0005F77908|nr:SSI family serine proteinase inhibitor [Streptomyces sp. WMMB 714]SCK40202.1 Subtilisin inhibitor-like [Streptomyces sp. WMMB 714]